MPVPHFHKGEKLQNKCSKKQGKDKLPGGQSRVVFDGFPLFRANLRFFIKTLASGAKT